MAGSELHPANLLALPEVAPLARPVGPVLFKRHTSPLNVIGGYRFPNAPKVSLRPTSDREDD